MITSLIPGKVSARYAMAYRSDIDGLRAVAVLAVIFFHAGIPGFTGGFVGVDVFFVISGFLITSIILKEINAGKFSVARFYERRIRRIFPALFPVISFTLIVGAFLFDPFAFKAFGKSMIATTFFGSNILFFRESGYFDSASITKPLLHTWSLAVEEQFYLFFPLLLIAINRFSKNRYLPWLLGIGFVSLLASVYGVYTHQVATFYLIPTRAWELLFGSILALGVIPQLQSNVQRNFLSIAGLSLIVFSIGFYTESTLFPGSAALAPVIGSSLIIYSGMGGGGGSAVSKFLSLKPMVSIGLISYSLYLWHWPFFVFAKYLIFRELTPFEITGIICATVIISILSLKFIEQPFRGTEPVIPNQKNLFALSAMVMIIASIIGTVIFLQKGMPARYPDVSIILKDISNDPEWDNARENEKITTKLSEGKIPARIGVHNTMPCFILWGDSHARALIPAVSLQANRHGISGYITTQSGHPPVLGMDRIKSNMTVGCSHTFNDGVISFIKQHPEIKTVILTAAWECYANGIHFNQVGGTTSRFKDMTGITSNQSNLSLLRIGLTRTIVELTNLERQVVIVSDVPDIGYDVVRNYWLSYIIGRSLVILPTLSEYRERNKNVYALLHELEHRRNVTIIYPETLLVDKTGRTIAMDKSKLYYRDSHHLSKYGAEFISPVFDGVFKKRVFEDFNGLK